MKLTEQTLSGNRPSTAQLHKDALRGAQFLRTLQVKESACRPACSRSITGSLLRGARLGVQAEVVEVLDLLTRTDP